MNETHMQDRFVVPFLVEGLGYQEVKANMVGYSLIIEEDLEAFISETTLNKKAYETLLRKYKNDRQQLLGDLIDLIQERSGRSRNMALFLAGNKSVSLKGVQLFLFYTSDSVTHGNALFEENIFSVVQELPYRFSYQGHEIYSFRPDLVFFVNGLYVGYSELKSNFTGQSARDNGRRKVIKDYFDAVRVYYERVDSNDSLSANEKEGLRRDFLKIFERAIHITSSDVGETYVIRNLSDFFDDVLATCRAGKFDREAYEKKVSQAFKAYPVQDAGIVDKQARLKEIFTAHYGKGFAEKEILYYNFIERDVYKVDGAKALKDERGNLISPRPKQKFGTDKILAKIDEFLAHEGEDDYFVEQIERQLAGVSEAKKKELIDKRRQYANNKNVYSLLLQYAAGFGKSNIIGWTALQLKDLRRNGEYVYDKIMIVVDRLQLRDQIDAKMFNMNIENNMFVEARNKKTFLEALASDTRIVIVNLQKFGHVAEMLDQDVLGKMARQRVVFLIDEIHRSHTGDQHEEMVTIFDELQSAFDKDQQYNKTRSKKNLIIGFTATPTDHALARFGEFSGYAEGEKLWVPFDAYTMQDAITDGYILNPLKNIVPVASKMIFDLPANDLAGLKEPSYKDANKKQIYENRERIDAIAQYVADLLVKDVYPKIWGTAKAMLAVHSIKAAIAYKDTVTRHFNELVKEKRYEKYAEAPIYIVYSDSQDEQRASQLNDGLSEQKVLENFALRKNGLIIVVDKLQTGFDEKRLHTLFLDKEVSGVNAIQTISRVNRTTKHKNDCKIVDFSYNNVNVQSLKDAFDRFSNVVVSDFDPFGDAKVLDVLYTELKKSTVWGEFYDTFAELSKGGKGDDPERTLALESRIENFIAAYPDPCADAKAKGGQYFTLLNRIEYVISLNKKYSDGGFLAFWRKFNTLYNMSIPSGEVKDSIEVYFDNRIGMIEVETEESQAKQRRETEVATGKAPGTGTYQYSILDIIEARNRQEEVVGALIQEFEKKIEVFFDFVLEEPEGKRLVVKIRSKVDTQEICEDFGSSYRRFRILRRKEMGARFFQEIDDMVDKLCADFEAMVRARDIEGGWA